MLCNPPPPQKKYSLLSQLFKEVCTRLGSQCVTLIYFDRDINPPPLKESARHLRVS